MLAVLEKELKTFETKKDKLLVVLAYCVFYPEPSKPHLASQTSNPRGR